MTVPDPSLVSDRPSGVMITGVDVPFGDLVVLMVKLLFAGIPAGILAYGLWYMVLSFLSEYGSR